MAKKVKQLLVVIRYEGKPGADWHLRDVVAIFPTEPGTDDPRTMVCYSTIGQHGACVAGYAGSKTKPATGPQVRAMLKELHKVGYRNLKVVSRASSHHAAERRAKLK